MGRTEILSGLNKEQHRAAQAVRGPVVILAGAGSGKTTTITRRLAYQVATGTFEPRQLLAVTFTDKAAAELRTRLEALGAYGIEARTFHSAAYSQLRRFGSEPPGRVLPSKVPLLGQLRTELPTPYRFRQPGDLATEIEWARNRRIRPPDYLQSLGGHEPPIPPELMAGLFASYERRKRQQGLIDFEDQLELAIQMFRDEQDVLGAFRARYLAFTVDEYQDVNTLQQTILDLWLGDREDVCVVGDDHQAIYSFIGSSPRYLLAMEKRFATVEVIRLEQNYRSTPEILEMANRLARHLGGVRKTLRATHPSGPPPVFTVFETVDGERRGVARRIEELHRRGVPYEQMAILYRVNFRSEDFEEVLSREHIPYQVRGGAFLTRPGARSVVRGLRKSASTAIAREVRTVAGAQGMLEHIPSDLGEEETTRQNDLARMVRLAEEFQDGERTVGDFLEDLEARFFHERDGRGVNLLTYHRAKGLEFEAVFLPRLVEEELPYRRARSEADRAEERRLFYVGLTRAKAYLWLSWAKERRAKASSFLAELGLVRGLKPAKAAAASASSRSPATPQRVPAAHPRGTLFDRLTDWANEVAKRDGNSIRSVFGNEVLARIASQRPRDWADLAAIDGLELDYIERYGEELLRIVQGRSPRGQSPEPPPSLLGKRPKEGRQSRENAKSVGRIRQTQGNAYEKWTLEQDTRLIRLYRRGYSTGQLAQLMRRGSGAIRSRLKKLGELS